MHDTKEKLICPVCGKEMKKVFSEKLNFNVDICLDGCGGIFFDNRELKKVDELQENADFIFDAIKDKTFSRADSSKKLQCPCCSAVMVKNPHKGIKELQIDECYSCGGIFLNNGELEKIQNNSSTDKARREIFNRTLSETIKERTKKEF